MRYVTLFVGSLLLASCSSMDLPEPAHAPLLSTADVIHPFVANPNVLEASAQLQADYSHEPVQVLRVGDQIKVTYPSDVLFGVGGEELLPSAQTTILAPLVKVAQEYPQALIRIDCFTDTSGSAEKNVAYSEERAQSIARYLLTIGIVRDNISLKGYGGAYPVTVNETAAGRALNRRAVLTISAIPAPLVVK